jgi:hypothetical protein
METAVSASVLPKPLKTTAMNATNAPMLTMRNGSSLFCMDKVVGAMARGGE